MRKIKALVILVIAVPLVSLTLLPPASGAVSGPLKYTLGYKGYASPGATMLLIHNFTANWSTTDLMINSFTVTTQWSSLNATGRTYNLPLIVSWPGSKLINTTVHIPASTFPGKYPVNVWVNWEYNTIFSGWQPGRDLVLNATLRVSPTPPSYFPIVIPSLPTWTLSGILFYLATASFVTVMVARREEKRKHNLLDRRKFQA